MQVSRTAQNSTSITYVEQKAHAVYWWDECWIWMPERKPTTIYGWEDVTSMNNGLAVHGHSGNGYPL